MIQAIFQAQFLNLLRDRGALAMTFILPAVFFIIFAEIFTGAAGTDVNLTVAISDEMQDDCAETPNWPPSVAAASPAIK